MIEIVCYTGGTCGDLVTSLIDNKDSYFKNKAVMFAQDRTRFKKPHTFTNDVEKDQYLDEISHKYKSIPSHDLQYHIKRGHNFIGITVQDLSVARWASTRFKELHRPHVWEEMSSVCGVKSVEEYAQTMIDFSNLVVQHTNRIITLESIRDGTALQNPILKNTNKTNFYQNWLDLQNGVLTA
jgi:hypothetical protein